MASPDCTAEKSSGRWADRLPSPKGPQSGDDPEGTPLVRSTSRDGTIRSPNNQSPSFKGSFVRRRGSMPKEVMQRRASMRTLSMKALEDKLYAAHAAFRSMPNLYGVGTFSGVNLVEDEERTRLLKPALAAMRSIGDIAAQRFESLKRVNTCDGCSTWVGYVTPQCYMCVSCADMPVLCPACVHDTHFAPVRIVASLGELKGKDDGSEIAIAAELRGAFNRHVLVSTDRQSCAASSGDTYRIALRKQIRTELKAVAPSIPPIESIIGGTVSHHEAQDRKAIVEQCAMERFQAGSPATAGRRGSITGQGGALPGLVFQLTLQTEALCRSEIESGGLFFAVRQLGEASAVKLDLASIIIKNDDFEGFVAAVNAAVRGLRGAQMAAEYPQVVQRDWESLWLKPLVDFYKAAVAPLESRPVRRLLHEETLVRATIAEMEQVEANRIAYPSAFARGCIERRLMTLYGLEEHRALGRMLMADVGLNLRRIAATFLIDRHSRQVAIADAELGLLSAQCRECWTRAEITQTWHVSRGYLFDFFDRLQLERKQEAARNKIVRTRDRFLLRYIVDWEERGRAKLDKEERVRFRWICLGFATQKTMDMATIARNMPEEFSTKILPVLRSRIENFLSDIRQYAAAPMPIGHENWRTSMSLHWLSDSIVLQKRVRRRTAIFSSPIRSGSWRCNTDTLANSTSLTFPSLTVNASSGVFSPSASGSQRTLRRQPSVGFRNVVLEPPPPPSALSLMTSLSPPQCCARYTPRCLDFCEDQFVFQIQCRKGHALVQEVIDSEVQNGTYESNEVCLAQWDERIDARMRGKLMCHRLWALFKKNAEDDNNSKSFLASPDVSPVRQQEPSTLPETLPEIGSPREAAAAARAANAEDAPLSNGGGKSPYPERMREATARASVAFGRRVSSPRARRGTDRAARDNMLSPPSDAPTKSRLRSAAQSPPAPRRRHLISTSQARKKVSQSVIVRGARAQRPPILFRQYVRHGRTTSVYCRSPQRATSPSVAGHRHPRSASDALGEAVSQMLLHRQ